MKQKLVLVVFTIIFATPWALSAKENIINKKISIDTLESNSSAGFYTIKNNLMKKVLQNSDFSEVNLSKNFTLKSFKDGVFYMESPRNGCVVEFNRTTQVLYKFGKAYVIDLWTDGNILRDKDCNEYDLKPMALVEIFNIPTKEEFKEIFIKGATRRVDANNPTKDYYTEEQMRQALTFNILEDGFSVKYPGDDLPTTYREMKIVNPIKVWEFSEYDFEEYGVNLTDEEMNTEINYIRDYNAPFAGMYRAAYKSTQPNNQVNTQENKKTVSELLKSLNL